MICDLVKVIFVVMSIIIGEVYIFVCVKVGVDKVLMIVINCLSLVWLVVFNNKIIFCCFFKFIIVSIK